MTNNDEMALKIKAAAEKAGAEEWQVKRNGPGEYEVMVKGSLVKHSGWSTHRPVADEIVDKKTADFIATASPANILTLLAERDADKKVITESAVLFETLRQEVLALERDVDAANARVDTKCAQLCNQDEQIEMLRLRIAELEARTVSVKLPKPHAHLIWIQAWHGPDDYWDDVAVSHSLKDRCCDGSERYPVYSIFEIQDACAAAGIKLEVGE